VGSQWEAQMTMILSKNVYFYSNIPKKKVLYKCISLVQYTQVNSTSKYEYIYIYKRNMQNNIYIYKKTKKTLYLTLFRGWLLVTRHTGLFE
jgi:hypothetical protein